MHNMRLLLSCVYVCVCAVVAGCCHCYPCSLAMRFHRIHDRTCLAVK